uniref:Uncharacterized protein n=1 Tax=Rhizophora mucronata TaxID=61149 RepID=A0A2P2PEV7_RHIMU
MFISSNNLCMAAHYMVLSNERLNVMHDTCIL